MEQIKNRNMIMQIFLMIITLGLYFFYWFYKTGKEFKTITKEESAAPGLWTMLFFIPFGAFYSLYKYAELFGKVSSEKVNKWIIFLLWIVFAPAVWFLVQTDLNTISNEKRLFSN